jgi:small-conductance mechanosensitive channel
MQLVHRIRMLGLAGWLLVPPAGAAAQGPTPADTGASGLGAPVVYRGDTLFLLHARLGPFDPAQRAASLVQRLARLAPAIAAGRDSLQVADVEGHSEILAGDQVLMTVLDGDAAPEGMPRRALARTWLEHIHQAASLQAEALSLRSLAIDFGKAAVTTGLLVGILWLLTHLFARIYTLLEGPRIPAIRIQRLELLSAARVGDALTVVTRGLRVVLTVLLFYFYVPLVLSFFPWTQSLSRRIVGYVVTPLDSVWQGFTAYLPKVFFIAVIVVVTRYLLKVIRLIFRAVETGTLTIRGFHRDWADPTYNIVRFLVIAFAAVVMFPYLPGAGSDAFKGVSIFVGVLFSLGSSSAIGNVVAGVVLTYTRAFQIGDRVKIGETVGDVVERTLLVTRVRTIKNVEITIPNGTVLSNQVLNFTTSAATRGLILHTAVTIGYDAPWRKVHELLIAAARQTEAVLADPAPFVFQTSLDDFFVSYEINAYTDRPEVMARTYSLLHQNIQDQFNQAGVEIMSPHYGALRDGNAIAIPPDQRPHGYRTPSFRVDTGGGGS